MYKNIDRLNIRNKLTVRYQKYMEKRRKARDGVEINSERSRTTDLHSQYSVVRPSTRLLDSPLSFRSKISYQNKSLIRNVLNCQIKWKGIGLMPKKLDILKYNKNRNEQQINLK